MFTVSGSSSSGDLADKNSPFSYILFLYLCIYTLTTSTNMYKKKTHHPFFCVYIILISVVPGYNISPDKRRPYKILRTVVIFTENVASCNQCYIQITKPLSR